jgi:hypothetical protein
MNSYTPNSFRNNFFAVICAILFSSTLLLSAAAPALAGAPMANETPAVVAPLA